MNRTPAAGAPESYEQISSSRAVRLAWQIAFSGGLLLAGVWSAGGVAKESVRHQRRLFLR